MVRLTRFAYKKLIKVQLAHSIFQKQFDTRGILIHVGNYPDDSKGCLLPGSSRTIDFVGNSKITLPKITNYVASKNFS